MEWFEPIIYIFAGIGIGWVINKFWYWFAPLNG